MISCKEATFLISKKEENKLSFVEKIKLKMHLLICSFCRLFEKQSKLISMNASKSHQHYTAVLSDSSKENIIQNLKDVSD